MEKLNKLLNFSVAEISVKSLLIVVGCTLCTYLIDRLAQFLIRKISDKIDKEKPGAALKNALLVSLAKPLHVLCLTLTFGLGLTIIRTPSWAEDVFHWVFVIMRAITIWCVIWYLLRVTGNVTEFAAKRADATEDKLDDMIVPMVSGTVKVLLVTIGVLLVVQNLGYSVSSLITGLGIGGAALALASKDTLANMFGALVVFLDRPFNVGDWISLNGFEGTVEEIRFRTTLIRTFDNSLVMMPNSYLTNACVNNFQRREYRKMNCSFGVLYSTKAEQIEHIVSDIRTYLGENQELFGPNYYVGFKGFGDSSLDIEVIAYTHHKSYAQFYSDRQTFALEIMRIVERNGTGFAFPTRTLEWASNSPAAKIMPVEMIREGDLPMGDKK